MEQELVDLRERVAFLTGAVSDAEKQIDALNAKADTVIGLLTDIRAMLLYQNTAPSRHFDDVMNEARDHASHVTNR